MTTTSASTTRALVNKVPEITVFFWLIKVLATTVGETAADYLNETLGLGLTGTTLVAAVLLVAILVLLFGAPGYVPVIYWSAVVVISVAGTLITDNLTDNYGVALELTTAVFSIALAVTFAAWYAKEGTLSIHTIYTTRREAFYWAAILFTFALGTAAGDLVAEQFGVGYAQSAFLFGSLIVVVAIAHYRFGLNAVAAFRMAYILTRPLGATIGDYLSQSRADGGLGVGTTATSVVFLTTILALVAFLAITRKDVTPQIAA